MRHFNYELVEDWPPLTWLARCDRSERDITVFHGPRVDVHPQWFCEAVWDGPFHEANFDQTDLVFGSGGRLRGSDATFVASSAPVDRLQSLEDSDGAWVSNSLACLISVSRAVPALAPPTYRDHFGTVIQGLDKYKRHLPLSNGTVRLTYFHNLKWDGAALSDSAKPETLRDLATFKKYRDFLQSALGRIAENLSATTRRHSYQMLGTASSGYDSPTVTVLARQAGLREVISFKEARGGEADDAREIAAALGLELTLVNRDAWRARPLAEVPFIASDAKGEDVYYSGAHEQLHGRVLLTGYNGGKVWGKHPPTAPPTIVRGDQSGLSLTEYRLWAGFIHMPVPFMGVRQIRDINKITHLPEMAPWDVPGKYTRPICRRIVEEAGVARHLFGMTKKATSVIFSTGDGALLPATRDDYDRWRHEHGVDEGRAMSPGLRERLYWPFEAMIVAGRTYSAKLPTPLKRNAYSMLSRLEPIERHLDPFAHLFPWAIDRATARYQAEQVRKEPRPLAVSARKT